MSNDILANYAVVESKSRGRQYNENYDDAKYRSVFGRDRDRIIGSPAFRRLQYKTQVFVNYHGDHYRTRLTHSLEVAQIARWIAGGLKANKDLSEIVALTHDLGHAPFGHAGEEALDFSLKEYAKNNPQENFGENFGFSHNSHSLKIITKLENRFIDFQGLNLSWETLEGTAKHNGPILKNHKTDQFIREFDQEFNLDLDRHSSIEAQISAIADDIAYNNHDLEDGLRAQILTVEKILELDFIGQIYREIQGQYNNVSRELLAGEAKKRLILAMTVDVIENTQNNIKKFNIKTQEDIRNHPRQIVSFSDKMQEFNLQIKDFLMHNMYRHSQVNHMSSKAKKIVTNLFEFYIKSPQYLPEKYHKEIIKLSKKEFAIHICNYIAGMTDRFAINTNNKFCGYETILKPR